MAHKEIWKWGLYSYWMIHRQTNSQSGNCHTHWSTRRLDNSQTSQSIEQKFTKHIELKKEYLISNPNFLSHFEQIYPRIWPVSESSTLRELTSLCLDRLQSGLSRIVWLSDVTNTIWYYGFFSFVWLMQMEFLEFFVEKMLFFVSFFDYAGLEASQLCWSCTRLWL